MALVRNNSARIYNIQVLGEKGKIVRLRLDPVVNSIPDDVWAYCEKDVYVKQLKATGELTIIDELDHNPLSEAEKPIDAKIQVQDYETEEVVSETKNKKSKK